jgi:hypothetical protein
MPISIQALAASSDPDYELITFHLPLEPRAADVITQVRATCATSVET